MASLAIYCVLTVGFILTVALVLLCLLGAYEFLAGNIHTTTHPVHPVQPVRGVPA